MAKSFAKRTSKRERTIIDGSKNLGRDIFKLSDERLLRGARLQEVPLNDITVKEQVRTKFNDSSLKELGENIKANGLIQPLVLHLENGKYVLICGERRFRAMNLIKMEKAPCFILENKSAQELMAIQFSENLSRENLHYIDTADGIYNYQKATGASERKIQTALGISKSEVHRSLIIAKLTSDIKNAAKVFNIEKYVLLEFRDLSNGQLKNDIKNKILKGEIRKRTEFKSMLRGKAVVKVPRLKSKVKTDIDTTAILAAVSGKGRIDASTKKMIKELLEKASENN